VKKQGKRKARVNAGLPGETDKTDAAVFASMKKHSGWGGVAGGQGKISDNMGRFLTNLEPGSCWPSKVQGN